MMPSSKSRIRPKPSVRLQFEAIGTVWVIDLEIPPARAQEMSGLITRRIVAFDEVYSRFRPDSLVTAMATKAGTYTLPPDGRQLLDFYRQMYDITGGAVTPLIGKVLSDAGYDAAYSLRPGVVGAPPAWDEVLTYQYPQLELARPSLLDFGAAGKGYLVDIIAELLEANGVTYYCVDAGGDIRARGFEGQYVGLEDPDDASRVVGHVLLDDGSICGSAGNRRRWAGYHHIIDPRSLESPVGVLAVWAIAGSTMVADGMATCLFFTDPAILQKHFTFEYVIIYADHSVRTSAHVPGTIFTKDSI